LKRRQRFRRSALKSRAAMAGFLYDCRVAGSRLVSSQMPCRQRRRYRYRGEGRIRKERNKTQTKQRSRVAIYCNATRIKNGGKNQRLDIMISTRKRYMPSPSAVSHWWCRLRSGRWRDHQFSRTPTPTPWARTAFYFQLYNASHLFGYCFESLKRPLILIGNQCSIDRNGLHVSPRFPFS
jgi:hypothetical protein